MGHWRTAPLSLCVLVVIGCTLAALPVVQVWYGCMRVFSRVDVIMLKMVSALYFSVFHLLCGDVFNVY